jgi:hypothetical protein
LPKKAPARGQSSFAENLREDAPEKRSNDAKKNLVRNGFDPVHIKRRARNLVGKNCGELCVAEKG